MKRCPTCQSIYTDDSLSYCLQDGSQLATLSDSASSADVTWQISGAAESTRRGEPPPTEILQPEDMPTARVEATAPTREQQRARPTVVSGGQPPPATATVATPRGNLPVIVLSAAVAMLLIALGGLVTWIMMRDKGQTQTRTAEANSNQADRQRTDTSGRTNSNTNPSASTTPQPSPVDIAAAQKEVQAALNDWADTIRQRNLEGHMKYYADVLDTYYTATNVSRNRVRADREAAFTKYTSMDMQLTNVNIEIDRSGTRATATFDKTFDFRNDEKSFNGSGLNRFWLARVGGRWRITGEKDLKTYYVNR